MEQDETDERLMLEALAADIKQKFIDKLYDEYNGQSSFMGFHNARYDKDWYDAAKLCAALDADPATFVNCQFRNGVDVKKLFPAYLKSSVARQNYISILSQVLSPQADWDIQIQYLQGQIYNAKREIENILMDDDIDFSAWFRILISVEPIPQVLAKYKERARKELGVNVVKVTKGYESKLLKFIKAKGLDYTRITE